MSAFNDDHERDMADPEYAAACEAARPVLMSGTRQIPVSRVLGWIEYLRANRERIHAEAERDIALIEDIIAKRKG